MSSHFVFVALAPICGSAFRTGNTLPLYALHASRSFGRRLMTDLGRGCALVGASILEDALAGLFRVVLRE